MKVIAEMWTWSTADSKRKVGERTSDHIRGELLPPERRGLEAGGCLFQAMGIGLRRGSLPLLREDRRAVTVVSDTRVNTKTG